MFGTKDMKSKINKKLEQIDMIKSVINTKQLKRKTTYALRRKIRKIWFQIKNKIKEIHHKVSLWLCRHYNRIFLPHYGSKNMSKSNLFSKVKRSILTWGHYNFRQILLNKASKRLNCKVNICTEEYTSKTCGGCSVINYKLGRSETFSCPSCGLKIDRDINAARNILLLNTK